MISSAGDKEMAAITTQMAAVDEAPTSQQQRKTKLAKFSSLKDNKDLRRKLLLLSERVQH